MPDEDIKIYLAPVGIRNKKGGILREYYFTLTRTVKRKKN